MKCPGGPGVDVGGNGGQIAIFSNGSAATNTGSLSVRGGTGAMQGTTGVVEIDDAAPFPRDSTP